ncbi:UDP-2,3-diacylglucosamine diphosphatase [Ramlibacter algicola]|uniref:UDP-2,3-diacylglucosamine diphosphatase n=1 Tax=Ramlibacter algicola TaxID=2795217 RepID=UPI003084209B
MAPPPIATLDAPAAWRRVALISDLHLQASEPATLAAWRRFMAQPEADAVFILGDLFEAWPGDDWTAQPGFAADCAQVLREAAASRPVFLLHGNRDFLVGDAFARETGVQLLQDPTMFAFAGRRWLLTHGDALCLDDVEYLRFREQVRDSQWQAQFLAQPLARRLAIAQSLRTQSEARKRSGVPYADVDTPEALAWLRAAQADTLVHGHTHKPGDHALDAEHARIVLSDWDLDASPPRGEVLLLSAQGAQRVPVRA